MTVLCSDKTGTLTTADMRVLPHRTWTNGITKDDALLYACLSSNPANKEDPIDKAILGSGHEHFGEEEASSHEQTAKGLQMFFYFFLVVF